MTARQPAGQKAVADSLPASKEPMTAPPTGANTETIPTPFDADLAERLHRFVAWRRENIRKAVQPGVNRGGSTAIRAGQEEQVLRVLDVLATWLEDGAPGPGLVLSEEEKARWRWAQEHGLPVAAEIAAQL